MENKKSYYAIIPANVRYDNDLPAGAKLLYGEITALCNERGYCWASNGYFASLYELTTRTIQLWVKALEKKGYIHIKMQQASETNTTKRYIFIVEFHPPMKIFSPPHEENFIPPHEKNFTHNNTSNNNTLNSEGDVSDNTSHTRPKTKKFIPPTLEEVAKYIAEKRLGVNPQKFFDYYDAGDWHDAKGKAVKNWKQKCITWDKHDNNGGVTKQEPAPCFESDFIIG